MKNILIFVVVMLTTSLFIHAQNEYKAPLNASGEVEYAGEMKSSLKKDELITQVKIWFLTTLDTYYGYSIIDGDLDKGTFTVRNSLHGGALSPYHHAPSPFRGSVVGNTTYLFDVKTENNNVTYKIYDIKSSGTQPPRPGYSGSVTQMTLAERLKKVSNAKIELERLIANNGSKKAIKEQQTIIDVENKHLETIIPPLERLIENFKKAISK